MKKAKITPCAAWAAKLAAIHTDDLSPTERATLDVHLASCPACAAVYQMYQEIDARILALPPIEPLPVHPSQLAPVRKAHASPLTTLERNTNSMKTSLPTQTNHHQPIATIGNTSASRKVRLMGTISTIAAVLIVGAIIGGFLVLFASHHPGSGGLGSGSSPAVYVATDVKDSTIYALRPADGSILWQHQLDLGGQKLTQPPTVSHGMVYLSSYNGFVYALRTSDGTQLWSHKVGPLPDQVVGSDGSLVYIGAMDGAIYALRTSDGSQAWRYQTASTNAIVLAVTGGQVYALGDGLYALRAGDGSVAWHDPTLQFITRSFIVTNGKVYAPSGTSNILVLQASNGHHLQPLPFGGELASENNTLYVLGQELYAVRTGDDSILWHTQPNCPGSQLSANDGVIYTSTSFTGTSPVSSQQGQGTGSSGIKNSTDVCAFRASDGKQLWHWHLSTAASITIPLEADGQVYFGGNGLYALRASDGRQLWHIFQGELLQGPAVG